MFFRNTLMVVLFVLTVAAPGITGAKDTLIAVVEGEKIFDSDLEGFTANIPEPFKKVFKKKALNQIIDSKVFYALGIQEGLLDSKIYQKRMNKAKQKIVADLFIQKKIESRINISDKEVRTYYQKNKAKFNTARKILPGHIITKDKDIAVKLRKRINSDTFDKIASGFARDTERASYFKLDWIEKGKSRMPAGFEKAAFALSKGQISPVIQTKIGYHIIKVFDVKPARKISFDKIKNKLKSKLIQVKSNHLKQEYLNSANVKIIAEEYK